MAPVNGQRADRVVSENMLTTSSVPPGRHLAGDGAADLPEHGYDAPAQAVHPSSSALVGGSAPARAASAQGVTRIFRPLPARNCWIAAA